MSKKTDDILDETGSGPAPEPKISIGLAELQALISASSGASAEAFAKALNAQKTYKTDAEKANEEADRASNREQLKQIKLNRARDQANCSHKQGCKGSRPDPYSSSFVIHQNDVGAYLGICTACQKVIYSGNEADRKFFTEAFQSNNKMSQAGQRSFLDPVKAQYAGRPFGHDIEDAAPLPFRNPVGV